ncbi:hypothetical protein BU17DRAFT_65947 [Hysterangium stoloniferum]|nr:hypothetical protein BU17DRAFT_65947 [Hysterangium stoloniferum]
MIGVLQIGGCGGCNLWCTHVKFFPEIVVQYAVFSSIKVIDYCQMEFSGIPSWYNEYSRIYLKTLGYVSINVLGVGKKFPFSVQSLVKIKSAVDVGSRNNTASNRLRPFIIASGTSPSRVHTDHVKNENPFKFKKGWRNVKYSSFIYCSNALCEELYGWVGGECR